VRNQDQERSATPAEPAPQPKPGSNGKPAATETKPDAVPHRQIHAARNRGKPAGETPRARVPSHGRPESAPRRCEGGSWLKPGKPKTVDPLPPSAAERATKPAARKPAKVMSRKQIVTACPPPAECLSNPSLKKTKEERRKRLPSLPKRLQSQRLPCERRSVERRPTCRPRSSRTHGRRFPNKEDAPHPRNLPPQH